MTKSYPKPWPSDSEGILPVIDPDETIRVVLGRLLSDHATVILDFLDLSISLALETEVISYRTGTGS